MMPAAGSSPMCLQQVTVWCHQSSTCSCFQRTASTSLWSRLLRIRTQRHTARLSSLPTKQAQWHHLNTILTLPTNNMSKYHSSGSQVTTTDGQCTICIDEQWLGASKINSQNLLVPPVWHTTSHPSSAWGSRPRWSGKNIAKHHPVHGVHSRKIHTNDYEQRILDIRAHNIFRHW